MKRFGLFALLFLALFLTVPMGYAQTPSPGTAKVAASEDASTTQVEESGENVYRHSASVRLLARWLHLDQETAARTFEYLNFAVLAGAVLFYLAKNLPKGFRANREKIQHQLVDARTATRQANERLAAIEKRLGRLDEEIAAIGKQAEKDSLEDEARIKASIESERQRIMDSVTRDIASASNAAQRNLKQFAAGLAVDRAAQKLALTADEDHALLQEIAQSLSQKMPGRGENN